MSEESKTPRTDAFGNQPLDDDIIANISEEGSKALTKLLSGWSALAEELETELEAARRDAQRYRQVRLMLMELRLSKYLASLPQSPITFDVFDAAIDAALRQKARAAPHDPRGDESFAAEGDEP